MQQDLSASAQDKTRQASVLTSISWTELSMKLRQMSFFHSSMFVELAVLVFEPEEDGIFGKEPRKLSVYSRTRTNADPPSSSSISITYT
jgi:hypothetical protein